VLRRLVLGGCGRAFAAEGQVIVGDVDADRDADEFGERGELGGASTAGPEWLRRRFCMKSDAYDSPDE
jgi:hypothetical protein